MGEGRPALMARNLTWTANWVVLPLTELGNSVKEHLVEKIMSSFSWYIEFEVSVGYKEVSSRGFTWLWDSSGS